MEHGGGISEVYLVVLCTVLEDLGGASNTTNANLEHGDMNIILSGI